MSLKMNQSYSGFLFLFFFSCFLMLQFLIYGQSSENNGEVKQFDILLKEMSTALQFNGEDGLRTWARVNKNRIGGDFIFYIAQWAESNGSRKLLDFAEIIAKENGVNEASAYVFIISGKYYSLRSEYNNALESFKIAESFFNELNDLKGLGTVYVEFGQVCFFLGKNAEALKKYEKALLFFEKVRAPVGQGNAYFGIGQIYFQMGENTKALSMFKKAQLLFENAQSYLSLGNVYYAEGTLYSRKSENDKALVMYEKALPFFEKAQNFLGQGNVYNSIGDLYFHAGENAKALIMYEKALPLFEKAQDPLGQGNVYKAEGHIYTLTGENDKALGMYEKSLFYFEKAQNYLGQGNVYNAMGNIFLKTGENTIAIAMYEKALSFFKKGQNLLSQGNVYRSIGDLYSYISENAKALIMYKKALPLFEKVQDPIGQGIIFKAMGRIYSNMGENDKALAMYDKALYLFEKARDPLGQGNVYQAIGVIYSKISKNDKALAMYEKALPFFEKTQEPLGQGNVYQKKGDIYLQINNVFKALRMYERAIFFFEKAQDPLGLGNIYIKMGQIYLISGDSKVSLEYFEKALLFYEKAQDHIGQGNVYYLKGKIFFNKSEFFKALSMFEKALPFFEKAQEPLGQGNVYQALGEIYFHDGKNSKALEMLDMAILRFASTESIENSANAYIQKAIIFASQDQKTEALKHYEMALAYIESVRTRMSIPELKKNYFQKKYFQYENIALYMLENSYDEKGFHVVESMKARLFLDQLAENLAKVDKGLDPELKSRQEVLLGKLSALTMAIEQTAGKDVFAKLAALKNEKDLVQTEFDNLQVEIRLKNPAYALVIYPEPVSIDELQRKVLRPGEVLVEYYLSVEKAFVFIVTNEKFKAVELTAGSKKIRSTIRDYLELIGKPNGKLAENEKQIATGAALYDQLIKPLEPNMLAESTIIFVPDCSLAKLPFESLVVTMDPVSKKPVYFLEKNLIKYVQSASVLAFLRLQFKQEGVTDAFVGFGDPVYDYENFMKSKQEKGSIQALKGDDFAELNRDRFTREGGTFSRLKGSGEEVTEIAKLFKPLDKAIPKLRIDATEEFAKSSAMADYGYIQFSCHGLLGDGYQCLVLSQIPGAREDGFLTLSEFMNSSYKAKLIVLSACQTGKGTEERGEGVTGLTRAVMYAGSPAAVVSLWSVSDQATKDLMVSFYRYMLVVGLPKSEALRAAKLDIFKSERNFRISDKVEVSINHPFFWAAFVMYGE